MRGALSTEASKRGISSQMRFVAILQSAMGPGRPDDRIDSLRLVKDPHRTLRGVVMRASAYLGGALSSAFAMIRGTMHGRVLGLISMENRDLLSS